jgi:DNA polymerase V
MVTDLRPPGNQSPLELFENPLEERRVGHAGGPDWSMKRDMLSPRYTTHCDELPIVRAA